MAQKRLLKVCSTSKLNILKFASQKHMKCYPRVAGRTVSHGEGGKMSLLKEEIFCCGRRLGRHRRAGGRKRRRSSYDWRRASRAHRSYRRRRR